MRLAIGTAQFGMNYGLTNVSGKVQPAIVDEILALARENRINYIDTAANYGDAEKVIGRSKLGSQFNIVSKIPALPESGLTQGWFDQSLDASLTNLKCTTLDSLLVHKADDLLRPEGIDLWSALLESKKAGEGEKNRLFCLYSRANKAITRNVFTKSDPVSSEFI
ncbi:aldo/keto reductase [Chitinibacter sp. FCG-7]|uniref:Aldo/keto reductase n=1 Tax=Chitinibacter mangrovi TaxID=3153927 RepID=A0AAU7FAI3_9NEIS